MEKFRPTYSESVPTPNGVHTLIRQTHERRVLSVLRENGALCRADIAPKVGVSRTTLSEITNDLLQRGAIVVVSTDADSRKGSGRPAERLALDPASGQFMGVDFGHRRVFVAVADASHDIVASGFERYEEGLDWPKRVDIAFRLIERLGSDAGLHYSALQGIGIGVPGPYAARLAPPAARAAGRVRYDPSDAVDTAFEKWFSAPVIIDNNTRFAALAEAMRAEGDTVQDLIYIRLSDGVGGGVVVNGRLVTGAAGVAGELGHVTAQVDGDQCRCGKRGCLETVASLPAVLSACRSRGVQIDTLADLAAAVAVADPIVNDVLRVAATALGRVLGSAALVLNPSQIVVGGEIVRAIPAILHHVREIITYELFSMSESIPQVRAAEIYDEDGALGAINAIFHQSPLLADYPEASTTPLEGVPLEHSS